MKRVNREEAIVYLADVSVANVFVCCDGIIFRNVRELRDGLANMSEETYSYHANNYKNDFCRWVRDVIKDEKMAFALERARSRDEAANQVGTRVASLSRKHRVKKDRQHSGAGQK